ncbi:enoyl-CoA hydratase-related protein [Novosphingobium sp.]|uniref:enoyl-CoA hydratase-related protein n=1 Tax=Novosphingobium sp. TaxID=1874826 RepID=UPI001EC84889|nr:enoyl-CoA hydratase-related protein [Novosphingobium sp.]MBK6803045.1 enoyl-CoA hydratase/isomerase family protein [Novosphingobium sp.]MBK9012106.1 enoyl-CoA hydratase/isomerase family protein [Novosphingobium sp.]
MAQGYANLIVEQEGPILWVRLNRPEVLNAYTNELGSELVRAFGQADADDGVKVVVLTATGRVFCAGADVSAGAGAFDTESGEGAKNFGARDLDGRADGSRADSNFVAAMMNCRKPSLVAFNGSAAGVGLTLTLPCDIRIAADSAKFGCVFTRRGLVPEAGSAWFLPRLVGLSTALKWCMTGALVPASEALAAGLVSELVPADALEARARELALEIARNCSPVALALTRRMLWHFSAEDGPGGALSVDAALNIALGARGDVREGVSAFLEKRAPDFPLKVSADMPATPWWPDRPDLRN